MAPFRAELVLDTINTTFQLSDSVNCMEWSPNGNILAMGLSDGSVSVFNLGGTGPIDSRLFVSQAHKNGVQCIKWCNTEYDADNKLRFATGGFDGVVNIWTISQMSSSNFTAVVEHSINNGRGWIQSLCWLPDNRIAVASRKQLTVWTASDNPSAVLQPSPLPSTINHVQYDPRLQCLVVCAYGAVTLICVNDANREPNILDEKGSMLHCESVPLIESPLDSSVIFVGMQDEISMVWIVSRDEEDGIVVKQKLKLGGYAGKVSSVTTDSKHRFLASTGTYYFRVINAVF